MMVDGEEGLSMIAALAWMLAGIMSALCLMFVWAGVS